MREGSKLGFLSRGVMRALLKDEGKDPDAKEEFTREVT